MEQQAAGALALANGLRRNVTIAGRRWTQWPGGARVLAYILARIEAITQRLQQAANAEDADAEIAACIADLRTILEWTSYQSASLSTARAIVFARKTRATAARLGLLEDSVKSLAMLADSERSLIDNVEMRNGHMIELAERSPHLNLPKPIVDTESFAPSVEKAPGKLDLIQKLMNSRPVTPRKKK